VDAWNHGNDWIKLNEDKRLRLLVYISLQNLFDSFWFVKIFSIWLKIARNTLTMLTKNHSWRRMSHRGARHCWYNHRSQPTMNAGDDGMLRSLTQTNVQSICIQIEHTKNTFCRYGNHRKERMPFFKNGKQRWFFNRLISSNWKGIQTTSADDNDCNYKI
jgi:Tfp pilus assembly protein FimT